MAAKIVPKLLNFGQKQCCMDIGQEKLTMFNDDAESGVYGYDIEIKAQSFRYGTIEEIKKIEEGAVADTKKGVSRIGKNAGISDFIFFFCFEGDKIIPF